MKINLAGAFISTFTLLFFSCSDTSGPVKEPGTKAKTNQPEPVTRPPKNYLTDCRKLYRDAKQMDSLLLRQSEVDQGLANKAIKAFTDFAYYCQSDSMSPVFLIKTAQVARAIHNIPQAKLALDRCIETYPSFKNRPAALFLLAQLYDERSYLNNESEARELYQKIIDEYPKSDWAVSAQGAIHFLGKTDEEILKEFKKRSR